jgi:hypothetical protein
MTLTAEDTHLCPIGRCPRQVPLHLLMCGIHWRLCPSVFQRAVNAAYDNGRGLGTAALRAAQRAAIDAVNNRIAATTTKED